MTDSESACFASLKYRDTVVYKEEDRDPWELMKALPPPSICTIKGLRIEELEPHLNFRRGFSLSFTPNIEDRLHVFPYFRAVQDAEMARRPRRFYLDLGGNYFATSTGWFLHYYPLDFTDIHVFEVMKNRFKMPAPQEPGFEESQLELPPSLLSRSIMWGGKVPPPIHAWQLQRVTLHEGVFVSNEDGPSSINITRFMKEELKLTPDDTVVVKMDIEQAEWRVLGAWLQDPAMPLIVDEIYVEMHYKHTSMSQYHWMQFNRTREEATRFFNTLRAAGFFVHPWP